MTKSIDIDQKTLTKLNILSAFEGLSVKSLMENAVRLFVEQKEKDRLSKMTEVEKEDLGLFLLMEQVDKTDTATEEEFFEALNQ